MSARTWSWHVVVEDHAAQDIELCGRAARIALQAKLKPDDALKLIEELTNALEELDIEVVRTEGGPRRRKRG